MKYIKLFENFNNIEIKPNVSRKSGFTSNLVYLSKDKNYACAYANGRTSDAHVYKYPIINGVLFYINSSTIHQHYGGDVFISGFKDDLINDLINYKKTQTLEDLTKDFLNGCGYYNLDNIDNKIINNLKKNDLSMIDVKEWSYMQEEYQGYSEICVKEVNFNQIIKVEIYKNEELIKIIDGGCTVIDEDDEEDDDSIILYHGSPLIYWKFLL